MSLYDDLPPVAPPPAADPQNADKPKKKRASFADAASDTPIVVLAMMNTSPKSSLPGDSNTGSGGLFLDLPPPSASSSLYGDLPPAAAAAVIPDSAASTSAQTANFSKHRVLAAALEDEARAQKRLKCESLEDSASDAAAATGNGEEKTTDENTKMELFVKKLAGVFTTCADLKKAAKACFILRDFVEKSVDSPAAASPIAPAINALFNAHSRFSDDKWLPSLCSVLEALQTKKAHFDDGTATLIDLWTCAACVVSRLNTSDDSFVVSRDLKFAQTLAEAIDADESLAQRTRRWACMAVAEAAFKRFRLQWMRTPIDMFFKVLRERRQHFDGACRTRIESMLDTMKARSLQSGTLSARSRDTRRIWHVDANSALQGLKLDEAKHDLIRGGAAVVA
jgi:hypothetical protein